MARAKTLPLLAGFILIGIITSFAFIRPSGMVAFLNVGQGDAIFLTTSSGEDILIDGGDNNAVLDYLGTFLPLWDRDIEVMILTHPHADHITGLIEVLNRYDVKRIFCACEGGDSQLFNGWQEAAKTDASVELVAQPQEVTFAGGARMWIYHPPAGEKSMNDQSLVVLFEDQGKRFLFMGDATEESEKWLLAQGFATDVDVLKVGHHGSESGTSQAFLNVVKPEEAVISVGANNSYHHPHQVTLDALTAANSEILRTDQVGTVVFWLENTRWQLSTMPVRAMPLMLDLWYNLKT